MGAGFNWGLPLSASREAPAIDFGIGLIHWAMLVMFIVWGGFMAWCLVRFRARPGHAAAYSTAGLGTAMVPDLLVVVFEVFLLAAYGIPYWNKMKIHKPAEERCTVVRIVAEQFAWNVHYPGPDGKFGRTAPALVNMSNTIGLDRDDPAAGDDVVTVNEMATPLGKPVLVYLSSKDVIHDFFVPEFRVKQDVVPGMRIPLWFEPTVASGAAPFEIGCAQLCGIAHYAMRGDYHVLEPAAYAAWLKARTP